MRTFHLVRQTDVTGISGTGTVAEGVEYSDGTTVVRWLSTATARPGAGVTPTTVIHESINSVIALHGHGRSTYVQYDDGTRLYQDDLAPSPSSTAEHLLERVRRVHTAWGYSDVETLSPVAMWEKLGRLLAVKVVRG